MDQELIKNINNITANKDKKEPSNWDKIANFITGDNISDTKLVTKT